MNKVDYYYYYYYSWHQSAICNGRATDSVYRTRNSNVKKTLQRETGQLKPKKQSKKKHILPRLVALPQRRWYGNWFFKKMFTNPYL